MEIDVLSKKAIKLAIDGNWKEAAKLNLIILKEDKDNIPALNRLAKAYKESNRPVLAKKIYRKVLRLDKYNKIAEKNLSRIPHSKKNGSIAKNSTSLRHLFLEEPGKTKIVKLVRLASPETLACVDCGDPVHLIPKKRMIDINSEDNEYLGTIPEDLSRRLIRLLNVGNKYEASIRGVGRQHLEILLRETYRDKSFGNQSSFPANTAEYIPPVSPKAIKEEKINLPNEEE